MAEASEVPLPQGGGDGDGLAATVGREEALQMMALTVLGAGAAEVDVVLPRYASGDADAQEAELAAIEGPLVPEEPVVPAAKRKKKQLKEKLADRALRLGLRAFGQAKVMRGRLLVFLVRRPLCSLALLQLLMFGLIGAMWKEGGLDTDFDSFLRANSNSSLRQDAYTHAWQVSPFAPVKKEGRRLQEETGRNAYHMLITVMYRNEVGGNILEEKQLYAILKFEQKMQARERWRTMCSMSMAGYGLAADDLTLQPASCSPGESLVNYVWPSYINGTAGASIRKGGRQQLVLDGKGNFRIPIPAVLSALRDEKDFFDRLLRFLPEGFSLPESGGTPFSDSVMSHFLFSPAGGPGLYYKTVRAAKVGVEEFLSTDIHEALNEKDKDLEELGIRVFYSAGPLDEADMFDALWKDCRMAIGGLVLVLIMVRIHTQSLSLSAFGSWLILESLPLGYVFFKQFTSLPDISVVNCLCIFVIVGIGSDFIFVLTDGWRQIEQEEQERAPSTKVESMDPREQEMRHQNRMRHRLVAVWRTAGVSCITTGLCAASSFLVNLVSVLLPLREFGLFMGLCCLFALFLELLMYPLALVAVDNAKFRKRLAAELEEGEDALTPEFSSTAVVPCEVSPEGRLVEVIVAGAVIKIDGGKPVIFPSSHNQVAGKALLKRYAPQTALAVQSSKQQAYLCSPTADLPGEPDTVPGCSTWSSMGYCTSGQFDLQVMCPRSCGFSPYCLAHWCDVAKPPNATKEAGVSGSLDLVDGNLYGQFQ
ncbi:unnamed protein product [Polarella glacialis]|uniref:SSD domain-containing protein n=1 Tax=Polarella glacialis TaxID=89957 RepID=A0A813GQ55_POLGL|nr:unnamed protein product [Polarella glacialis]